MNSSAFSTLFLDVGGVLLTNGWDRHGREEAIKRFNLDAVEVNERHALAFDTYEVGHLTLDEYLDYTVFYQSREFTLEQFKEFMFSRSQPLEMLEYIRQLKQQKKLKVVAVSNEGRELVEYRIRTFQLDQIFDLFVFSSFIHLRKPDPLFYKLALDLSYTQPEQVIYIDDRPLLAETGKNIGFHAICHKNLATTKAELESVFIHNH